MPGAAVSPHVLRLDLDRDVVDELAQPDAGVRLQIYPLGPNLPFSDRVLLEVTVAGWLPLPFVIEGTDLVAVCQSGWPGA